MKILLVNPNTFRNPPVPPLGLEYLEAALKAAGHETRLLDLTFEEKPESTLQRSLEDFAPAAAGVTVRNVDTVIYRGNEFFLDGIRPLIDILRESGVKTVLGGAGFSAFGSSRAAARHPSEAIAPTMPASTRSVRRVKGPRRASIGKV